MTDRKPQRGRPVGTGIDDRIWLRELGRIISVAPATPPTTAIRSLGFTDPSTIRRLREKHKRLATADAAARCCMGNSAAVSCGDNS